MFVRLEDKGKGQKKKKSSSSNKSNDCFICVVLDLCFINGECFSDGQTQVGKECLICEPNSTRTNWTLNKG